MRFLLLLFMILPCKKIFAQALIVGPISSVGGNKSGPDFRNVPIFPIVGLSITSLNIYSIVSKKKSEDMIGVSFLIGPAQLFYASEIKNTGGLNSKTINGFIGGTIILSGTVKFCIDKKRNHKSNKTTEYGK